MEEKMTGKVIPVAIEDEIKNSYLTYAMSVIVSRALPDVRDGLKPVHRRILYAMNDMGLKSGSKEKKCARIVGDVLGKYHPHGDQSVYDALVRMAQDFSLRYPVVNGQGNFGSIDGDPPAAMRYTEAKLMKIADEMLKDINKNTVDFQPNYDESLKEPVVLPAGFPYLLVNGASGIAVGMATNIAPHNLDEVVAATIAYIDNPDISIDEMMNYIKGPDFPTGGIIFGTSGIKKAFKTGRGRITTRAKVKIETTKSGKDIIVVEELPYAVNKANLVAKIASLINEKKLDGISDLRDESDKKGIRIAIELKKNAITKLVLNRLFTHTDLQKNFNVNNLAIVDGKPKLLNLKEIISHYVAHRQNVVTRRTEFELEKAQKRAHILVGLKKALDNIDEVIKIIKQSKNVELAKSNLISTFEFTDIQATAILDMKLQKLTSLETQKIVDELAELENLIAYYLDLLSDVNKILGVVKDELSEVSEKYITPRCTEIKVNEVEQIDIEDLIKEEDVVVLISNRGFIKRLPVSSYKNQGRGGRGSSSAKFHADDFLEHLFIASTHDYIFFVSTEGKAYWLKVHEIPEATKSSKGTHIKQLLSISANEEITSILSLKDFNDDTYIYMATRMGIVKKVPTSDFKNAKTRGIVAIKLQAGDGLVSSELTDGSKDMFLITRNGIALRYNEDNIRPMGRATKGVTGIKLTQGDEVVAVFSVNSNEQMLLMSEYGYGKRMEFDKISPHGRATKGQKAYTITEKTGELVGALSLNESDELVCITSQGITIKVKASLISSMGKTAMGVKIIDIKKPDFLVGLAKVVKED